MDTLKTRINKLKLPSRRRNFRHRRDAFYEKSKKTYIDENGNQTSSSSLDYERRSNERRSPRPHRIDKDNFDIRALDPYRTFINGSDAFKTNCDNDSIPIVSNDTTTTATTLRFDMDLQQRRNEEETLRSRGEEEETVLKPVFVGAPSATGKTSILKKIKRIYPQSRVSNISYETVWRLYEDNVQTAQHLLTRRSESMIYEHTHECLALYTIIHKYMTIFKEKEESFQDSTHIDDEKRERCVRELLKKCYHECSDLLIETSNQVMVIMLDLSRSFKDRYFERLSNSYNGIDYSDELYLYFQIVAYTAFIEKCFLFPFMSVVLVSDDDKNNDDCDDIEEIGKSKEIEYNFKPFQPNSSRTVLGQPDCYGVYDHVFALVTKLRRYSYLNEAFDGETTTTGGGSSITKDDDVDSMVRLFDWRRRSSQKVKKEALTEERLSMLYDVNKAVPVLLLTDAPFNFDFLTELVANRHLTDDSRDDDLDN